MRQIKALVPIPGVNLVGRERFELPQSKTPDLQSGWLQTHASLPTYSLNSFGAFASRVPVANPLLQAIRIWYGEGDSNSQKPGFEAGASTSFAITANSHPLSGIWWSGLDLN